MYVDDGIVCKVQKFQFMTLQKMSAWYSSSVDQYMWIRGLYTIPINIDNPRNANISSRLVGDQLFTIECGLITLCDINWFAYLFVSRMDGNNRAA